MSRKQGSARKSAQNKAVAADAISARYKPPVVSTNPQPKPRGLLEGVMGGTACGWAYTPGTLMRHRIALLLDGSVVAIQVADHFRPDLLDHGMGDGRHGFAIKLPDSAFDGEEHEIKAYDADSMLVVPSETARIRLPELSRSSSDPNADRLRIELEELFDFDYYRDQAGYVEDPLKHYQGGGWRRGLNPHPLFDTDYYIQRYGDRFTIDPLTHFIEVGAALHYNTHPLFDIERYCSGRPDVIRSGQHPLIHYLKFGHKEEPFPSDFFDENYYNEQCPGVREHGFIPILHYLRFGWREGRRPHREFHPVAYSRAAGIADIVEPLTHFARDLTGLATKSTGIDRTELPNVSIIIVNFSKPFFTLQCVQHVMRHTDMNQIEIIIIDNGSADSSFKLLCRHATGTKVIRLNCNRGFGEASNIAADHAQAGLLLFLNNDAFVCENWLPPLLDAVAHDPAVGAAGAKLIYPDGRLQEAGAMVASCGTALQRGKGLDAHNPLFSRREVVDYCSAAALLVRTASFRRALGFDMCWDPAYYEDADLCLKLRVIGEKTIYVPESVVVHVENGTSADSLLGLGLQNIVPTNRLKFVARWGDFLSGTGGRAEMARLVASGDVARDTGRRPSAERSLGLYTPYGLYPGGGERYLLSIATALAGEFRCTLVTPERYSRMRLATIARELGLDLGGTEGASLEECAGLEFDVFIAMGNELLPSVRPRGRLSFYHCQFPFPLKPEHFARNWPTLASYKGTIVNSHFTAQHLRYQALRLGIELPLCHIVYPPVPQIMPKANLRSADSLVILNVGRFEPLGHCKRQDAIIRAFRKLVARGGRPLELHLAGSLGTSPGARDYFWALRELAQGLPISFHLSPSSEQIAELYGRATFYWHVTGIGEDPRYSPERFEHFGISIAEAMSAGAIPVCLGHGGPGEIITDGVNGALIGDEDDLLHRSAALLEMSIPDLAAMADRAKARAAEFSFESFSLQIRNLVRPIPQDVPASSSGLFHAADLTVG